MSIVCLDPTISTTRTAKSAQRNVGERLHRFLGQRAGEELRVDQLGAVAADLGVSLDDLADAYLEWALWYVQGGAR